MSKVIKTASFYFYGRSNITYLNGQVGSFLSFTNNKKTETKDKDGNKKKGLQVFSFEVGNISKEKGDLATFQEVEIQYMGQIEEGLNFIPIIIKYLRQTSLEEETFS